MHAIHYLPQLLEKQSLTDEIKAKYEVAFIKLKEKNFARARDIYEEILSIYSADIAWLGKAIADINLNYSNGNYLDEAILLSIENFIKYNQDPSISIKIKFLLLLEMLESLNEKISNSIKSIAEKIHEQKQAEVMMGVSVLAAIAGGVVGAKSSSFLGKTLGVTTAVAGSANALNNYDKIINSKVLQESIFSEVIGLLLLSIDKIKIGSALIETESVDELLKNDFNTIIKTWKDNAIVLFRLQYQDLSKSIMDLLDAFEKIDKDKKVKKFTEKSKNIIKDGINQKSELQQRVEFIIKENPAFDKINLIITVGDLIGVDDHPAFIELKELLTKIKNYIHTDEIIERIKKIEKTNMQFGCGCLSLVVLLIFFVTKAGSLEIEPWESLAKAILYIGIIFAIYVGIKSNTSSMKIINPKQKKMFLSIKNKIEKVTFTKDDIDINKIGI